MSAITWNTTGPNEWIAIDLSNLLWHGIIYGNCQSKANSRRLVLNRKTRKPMFVKSKAALQFERDFILQTKSSAPFTPIEDDIEVTCKIFYQSRRNDLDESLVLDCLQRAGIIKNDRQVRRKIIEGFVDKQDPRVMVEIRKINSRVNQKA